MTWRWFLSSPPPPAFQSGLRPPAPTRCVADSALHYSSPRLRPRRTSVQNDGAFSSGATHAHPCIPATLRMPPRLNQQGRPRSDAPPAISDEFPCDVFLSHSAKDKAVVRAVAERLRKGGLRVWLDEWEIKGATAPGEALAFRQPCDIISA